MKWIFGLGNPGAKYDATPHNLGFAVADELARRWNLEFKANGKANALVAEGMIRGCPVRVVKPQTFMNLSGDAAAALMRQQPAGPDELLAVTDEAALAIGRLRIRPSGTHGGHNGLRSMIERLGHSDFARLRVGIAPAWPIESLVDYVLRKPAPLERGQFGEMVDVAADAAEAWLEGGSTAAAEKFNGQRRFGDAKPAAQ